jgi:membrane associated rhomboid family serine protease
MGAVLRIMFSGAGMVQLPDASSDAPADRLASVREMLRNKQFVTMVLVWMAFNVGLGLTGSLLTPGMGGIAWEAHIGGFAAGIALIGVFSTDRPGPEMDL